MKKTMLVVGVALAAVVHGFAAVKTETVNGVTWQYTTGGWYDSTTSQTVTRASVQRNGDNQYIGDIVVPATLGGYPVAAIEDKVFMDHTRLKSVVLPEGLLVIRDRVFYGCKALRGVTIPSTVGFIGGESFYNCTNLVDIVLPEGLKTISYGTFGKCRSLTHLPLPQSLRLIQWSAFSGCDRMQGLVLPDSIVSIGECAFAGCSSITELNIPTGVTSIATGTFSSCSSLTRVTIPSNVTEIASSAFSGCSGLQEVSVSDSVKSIGNSAFSNCRALTRFDVPASVEAMGEDVLNRCSSMETLKLAEGNRHFRMVGNCLVSADGRTLVATPSVVDEIAVPEGVDNISDSCFEAGRMKRVTLPSSVTNIGIWAFYQCSNLTEVAIAPDATPGQIGNYTFRECPALVRVTIPDSVTSIGEKAFQNCRSLQGVRIPDGVTVIRPYTFDGCGDLAQLSLPTNLTGVEECAFRNCSNLTELTMPVGLKSVGAYAFDGCASLAELTLPEGIENIYAHAFSRCGMKRLHLPEGIKNISYDAFSACPALETLSVPAVAQMGYGVFSQCSGLRDVAFRDGVTTVAKSIFTYCGALTNVTMTSSVTTIEYGAFQNCSNLVRVAFSPNITTIGASAFQGCSALWDFALPESLRTLGSNAFTACVSMKELAIGTNITSFGSNAFRGCCIEHLVLPDASRKWGAVLDSTYGTDRLAVDRITVLATTEVGDSAFSGFRNLREIVLPDTVTSIGDCAFRGSAITNLTISAKITHIGREAFAYCYGFSDVTIPDTVSYLGNDAFANCTNVVEVNLPSAATRLDTWFEGCPLTNVVIRGGDAVISWAFSGFGKLLDVKIPDSVRSIGDRAFEECGQLTHMRISAAVTNVCATAFIGCDSLKALEVDADNATYASANGFLVSKDGKTLVIGFVNGLPIPSGVETIGRYAFYQCYGLTEIIIPDGVTELAGFAFANCTNVVRVVIPPSVTSVTQYTSGECTEFEYCYGIRDVTIAYVATHLPKPGRTNYTPNQGLRRMFPNAYNNITNVVVDGGITELPACYFSLCSRVANVTFNGNAPTVEAESLSGLPASCTVTAYLGTTGWGDDETWNGFALRWAGLNGEVVPTGVSEVALEGLSEPLTVSNEWLIANGVAEVGDLPSAVSAKMSATGANGLPRYQSYILGMEPDSSTPAEEQLKVTIEGFDADGAPIISCQPTPLEPSRVTIRKLGRTTLPTAADAEWNVVDGDESAYNYFKVSVTVE